MDGIRKEVELALGREVRILQEMLGSMEQEQQALLRDDASRLQEIVSERQDLMHALQEAQGDRMLKVSHLKAKMDNMKVEDITESDSLEFLRSYSSIEHLSVHELYKKIAALLEAVKVYNERNQYLMKSRVQFTKELIYKLHPKEAGTIYGPPGQPKKKAKIATITIINHEG